MVEILTVFAIAGCIVTAVYRFTHSAGKWKRWILLALILSTFLAVVHRQNPYDCQRSLADFLAQSGGIQKMNQNFSYIQHEVGVCK